jgi:hypothetical protein
MGSFLGLANQLGIFISNLAAITDPLRRLLKKNITWIWTPDHQAPFKATKRCLAEPVNITPFDLCKPTVLCTDASSLHGMGYALEQEKRLIQAGSRSLLNAETRYAVVKVEATVVAWAIKACHHYLLASTGHLQAGLTCARLADGAFRRAGDEGANWVQSGLARPAHTPRHSPA